MLKFKLCFLLFLFLLTTPFILKSQTTAHFSVAKKFRIDQIIETSTGYLTLGISDTFGKLNLTMWDHNFIPIWNKRFIDSNFSVGICNFIVTPFNTIYLFTRSHELNGIDGASTVYKIDFSGNVVWQKLYHFATYQLPINSICNSISNDNGFVCSLGMCGSSGTFFKADSNGNVVWNRQYWYQPHPDSTTQWNLHISNIIAENNYYTIQAMYASTNANLANLFYRVDDNGSLTSVQKSYYYNMPVTNNFSIDRIIKLNNNNGYACIGGMGIGSINSQGITFLDNSFNIISSNRYIPGDPQFMAYNAISTKNGDGLYVAGSIHTGARFHGVILKVNNNGTIASSAYGENIDTTQSNSWTEFTSLQFKNNSLYAAGTSGCDGAIVAILDSNLNGLCKNISKTYTVTPITLNVEEDTIKEVLNSILVDNRQYQVSTPMYFHQDIYCGAIPNEISNQSFQPDVLLYPNPTSEKIFIQNKSGKKLEKFTMHSMYGAKIFIEIPPYNEDIDMSNFEAGIYFYSYQLGNKNYNGKIIKH